jgi:hypothetical protein
VGKPLAPVDVAEFFARAICGGEPSLRYDGAEGVYTGGVIVHRFKLVTPLLMTQGVYVHVEMDQGRPPARFRAMAGLFIRSHLDGHPLPWRVERDWMYEVLDAAGALVVKCETPEMAEDIVAEAVRLSAERAAAAIEIDKLVGPIGGPTDG